MKLDADLEALGGVLFSLLACSMRDDKPALRLATAKAARVALMEIPDAYLNPMIRQTASGGFACDICKDALSLFAMPEMTINFRSNTEPNARFHEADCRSQCPTSALLGHLS